MRSRDVAGLGLTLLAMLPLSAMAWGNSCAHSANRAGGVDATGVRKVVILTGPGDLKVVGAARNVRIEARGKACASSPEKLDDLQISVRREGDIVYVEAAQPRDSENEWNWGGASYAYLDTGIALPASIPVEASDTSGDAIFEELHSLNVHDSSGDLTVRNIAGLADITDSSGDVSVVAAGEVNINDSSGDLEIQDIRANVLVANDSSGDLRIGQVGGSVRIQNDSSGNIYVDDITGDVVVENDSSGDIDARKIRGDFTVSNDGAGSITHEAIGGRITLPEDAATN